MMRNGTWIWIARVGESERWGLGGKGREKKKKKIMVLQLFLAQGLKSQGYWQNCFLLCN